MENFKQGEEVEYELALDIDRREGLFRRCSYKGICQDNIENWKVLESSGEWRKATVTWADNFSFSTSDASWPQPSVLPELYKKPGCIRRINQQENSPELSEPNSLDRFLDLELK